MKLLIARTTADSGIDWSMQVVRQLSSNSVQPTTDLHELLATPPISVTTCLDLASPSQWQMIHRSGMVLLHYSSLQHFTCEVQVVADAVEQ